MIRQTTQNDPSAEESSHRPDRSPRPDPVPAEQQIAALRALPHGGIDDSTTTFALPPTVRATVSPAVAALRWGSIAFGLIFAAPRAFDGSYSVVVGIAICVFLTTWRTVIPIRLASNYWFDQYVSISDSVVFALAAGLTGGFGSPFFFCLLVAVFVVSFGWGYGTGSIGAIITLIAMLGSVLVRENSLESQFNDQWDLAALMLTAVIVATGAFLRTRFLDAEQRRLALAGQVDALTEANGLLTLVNTVARTLPSSLTIREAMESARRQIGQSFNPRVACILMFDERTNEWVPKLADGCVLQPSYSQTTLPEPFQEALSQNQPVLRTDVRGLTSIEEISDRLHGLRDHSAATQTATGDPTDTAGIADASTSPVQQSESSERMYKLANGAASGIYARLETRESVVGLIGLEHTSVNYFGETDMRVLTGLAEVLALTIDNARWFGKLRSLGAEEERIRIARDLHDRLGQWLTYISFELERIMMSEPARKEELDRLHGDVQAALDELRETLRQLRSGVSEDQPLSVLGRDIINRFAERADLDVKFVVPHPENRLPVPMENELLRILQEALNNIDKHAEAQHVEVVWKVDGSRFDLTITDDGRGFETARGVRDSAYGLVGMRERADVIGAQLSISSSPGHGTTVRVTAGIPADGSSFPQSAPLANRLIERNPKRDSVAELNPVD